MSKTRIPRDIMKKLRSVTSKRPRTMIEHILEHGQITTEELKERYGYNHPPRAARDVREQGIPLETFKVKDSTGRMIGAYRFGKWRDFRMDKLRGRRTFSKQFKKQLLEHDGERCHICAAAFAERYLQIDHRIPYEVAGDSSCAKRNTEEYMLVCSSCNRAKSWSCEHCRNWQAKREASICHACYWASPEKYQHVAMRDIRRLDLAWQENEVQHYDQLQRSARECGEELPGFVKALLQKNLKGRK